MKTIKSILKMIGGLAIGIISGLLIAALGILLFTDQTLGDFFQKFTSLDFPEILSAIFVGIISFVIAMVILVPVHELGHLVCGLVTGYGFVSFRIFNLTLIKENGKISLKKYKIAGTGGQCLLVPPEKNLDQISYGWYNAGGVLANILIGLLLLPLLWLNLNPFFKEFLLIFLLIDLILILMNGIPLKAGGITNDAYNLLDLKKNSVARRGMINQLRINALIQEGVRPKDMPKELFDVPDTIDYGNTMEVSIPLMAASRKMDEGKMDEALVLFEELYHHQKEIIPIYVNEIACEMAYLHLLKGDKEKAQELLNDKLRQYIETYRKVMASKERLNCAILLVLDGNRDKAVDCYENLKKRKEDYLLDGEVESDLSMIESLFSKYSISV